MRNECQFSIVRLISQGVAVLLTSDFFDLSSIYLIVLLLSAFPHVPS